MDLNIKEIIKDRGLTMQDVADKLEITRDTLTRNINGNPTVETLHKIANVLIAIFGICSRKAMRILLDQ